MHYIATVILELVSDLGAKFGWAIDLFYKLKLHVYSLLAEGSGYVHKGLHRLTILENSSGWNKKQKCHYSRIYQGQIIHRGLPQDRFPFAAYGAGSASDTSMKIDGKSIDSHERSCSDLFSGKTLSPDAGIFIVKRKGSPFRRLGNKVFTNNLRSNNNSLKHATEW